MFSVKENLKTSFYFYKYPVFKKLLINLALTHKICPSSNFGVNVGLMVILEFFSIIDEATFPILNSKLFIRKLASFSIFIKSTIFSFC